MRSDDSASPTHVGRYTLHGKIAAGGMATVHLGRLGGDAGFTRVVAIKRMHARFLREPQFVAMFLDEATLASRIQHPNVVPTLDVVQDAGEIFIVMEYVRGESLSSLLKAAARAKEPVPVPIVVGVISGVLAGLHAAHEARDTRGASLDIVHRDVSPHNILVGVDGVARIMDFGVAKASKQLHVTQDGEIKGKLSYMAPEQITGGTRPIDRGADIFAAGVVAWGMLAGRRLFGGADVTDTMAAVLSGPIAPLSEFRSDVPTELEAVLMKALERERGRRHATAREFETALEAAARSAPRHLVGAWVERLAAEVLASREELVIELEQSCVLDAPASAPLTPPVRSRMEPDEPTREMLPREPPPSVPSEPDVVGPPTTASDLEVPLGVTALPRSRRPLVVAIATGAFAAVAVVALVERASRHAVDPAGAEIESRPTATAAITAPSALPTALASAPAAQEAIEPPPAAETTRPTVAPPSHVDPPRRRVRERPAASAKRPSGAPAGDTDYVPERP